MAERRGGWPGPPRPKVSFRLGQLAVDWIDGLAARRGEHRSDTIRALLTYARRMPTDWKPPRGRLELPAGPRTHRPRPAEESFPCQLCGQDAAMVTDSTGRTADMGGKTDGELLLAEMGTDAEKWARELARALGNAGEGDPTGDMDSAPGSMLHTWLCNAIEAGRAAGEKAGHTAAAKAVTAYAYATPRPLEHTGCARAALGPHRYDR